MNIDDIKKKFPIFDEKIHNNDLVYLDSANSSQKPKVVLDRINDFYSKGAELVIDKNKLEEAKEIFESHGFLIDLWQHGLGSKNFFNFVMLSNSKEEQAKSLESLLNDQEWQRKQLDWMDKQKYGRLVESYEMTSLN